MVTPNHRDARAFARSVSRRGTNPRAVNLARAYLAARSDRAQRRRELRCLLLRVDWTLADVDLATGGTP